MKRFAIAMVAVVLLSSTVVVLYLYEIRRNANHILRSSYELFQQGQRPTLDDIRRRFGDELKQTSPCKDFGCGYEVVVSNRPLARFHLARFTTLSSSFWVRDGSLDENVVQFWTVRKGGWMILAYTDAKYCETCNDFSSGNSVNVDLGSQPLQKRAAFGFNTNCLLSLRGCATPADLLPAVQRE
jgi:hypothetical protein